MADISAEIAAFQDAIYGEDVRDSMVSLANKLNTVVTDGVSIISDNVAIINLDSIVPLQSGYYELSTAIVAVPSSLRKVGLIITYRISSEEWECAQYVFPSLLTSNFENPIYWKRYINDLKTAIENNTSAINVLQSKVEEEKKIEPGDTVFMNYESTGPNLFNKIQAIVEKTVYQDNGTTSSNNNYDSTSDYIDVLGATTISSNASLRSIVEYNNNKEFINTQTYKSTATLNSNTKYIRISFNTGTKDSLVIVNGATVPSEYIPYYKKYSFDTNWVDLSNGLTELLGIGSNIYDEENSETQNGIFNSDGSTSQNNNYKRTMSYIPVRPDQIYTIYVWNGSATILSGFRSCIFYNKNKEYIDGFSSGSNMPYKIKTPSNCYYIRFAYSITYFGYTYLSCGNYKRSSIPVYQSKNRFIPNIYEEDNVLVNSWQGKTIIGLGDSITQADGCDAGWLMRLADYFGMVGINHGINGSTIAIKESDPTTRYPMVSRYDEMEDDADMVIVLGGSNDWYYAWTPVGTMDDRTNYTFYGALHNLILGLIEKYENGKVVFATPIKRTYSAIYTNSLGYTLEQYCDIIKTVCAYYGVPCIDSNKYCQLAPFIEWQNTKYFLEVSDGHGGRVHDYTHPNDSGHEKIAELFVGQIRSLYP